MLEVTPKHDRWNFFGLSSIQKEKAVRRHERAGRLILLAFREGGLIMGLGVWLGMSAVTVPLFLLLTWVKK